MNQQDFIALIQASQTTLKEELLVKHPELKYDLLMLVRSFDLLKNYISKSDDYYKTYQSALNSASAKDEDIEQSIAQLCSKLRDEISEEDLSLLRQLNQADLSITHPKLVEKK